MDWSFLMQLIPQVATPLMKELNSIISPNHQWLDWDSMKAQIDKGQLTGQQQQQNAFNMIEAQKARDFNAVEAQKSRDFTMYMQQNKYAMETGSMQAAGINPALMYGNGLVPTATAGQAQGSAAQSSGLENGAGIGSLMDMMMTLSRMPKELELLDAQIEKTRSESKNIDKQTYKLDFDVEALRNQIEGSSLDNESKRIVNRYLDRKEAAEVRVKELSGDQIQSSIDKAYEEIEKMDYEELTMYVGWLDTFEHINYLQSQERLNDAQIQELGALVNKLNKEAKMLGLDINNYDDIHVIGTASQGMKIGPVSINAGEPITLGMKKAAEKAREEAKKKDKEKKPSMRDIKEQYPE